MDFWSDKETKIFIRLCSEQEVLSQMDKKTIHHNSIFKIVAEGLAERKVIKSIEQYVKQNLNIYDKNITRLIHNNKNGNNKSTFKFFDEMGELMGNRPRALSQVLGFDIAGKYLHILKFTEYEYLVNFFRKKDK